MKYIKTARQRVIFYGIIAFGVLAFLIYLFSPTKKQKDAKKKQLVITEKAPSALLYPVNDGVNYDASGRIKVNVNGKEYVVMPDGSVWEYDKDGNLTRVVDPKISNEVLSKALVSTGEEANKDAMQRNIDLNNLTEDQIKELAKGLGLNVDELRALVQASKTGESAAKTLDDAVQALDITKYSDEQLRELAKQMNVPYEDLKKIVDEAREAGKPLSITDATESLADTYTDKWIENNIKAAGLEGQVTVEDVKNLLKNRNMTPEDAFNLVSQKGVDALFEELGLKSPKIEQPETYGILNDPNNQNYSTAHINGNGNRTGANGAYDPSADISFLQSISGTSADNAYKQMNGQSEKKSFLAEFKTGTKAEKVPQKSMKNMITAGTVIKAVLDTGINTDLPGQITATVSENVYDSFSMTNILIPKFSTLIATYDSAVTWGQQRVMIAWTQLIRPDGVIVQLNGYQGVDTMGYAGQGGEVNNHIPSLIGATAMASLINVATDQLSDLSENMYLSALLSGTGTGINNAANNLLNHAINRQPTIIVEPGTKIMVMVSDNFELSVYED